MEKRFLVRNSGGEGRGERRQSCGSEGRGFGKWGCRTSRIKGKGAG